MQTKITQIFFTYHISKNPKCSTYFWGSYRETGVLKYCCVKGK